MVGYVSYLLNQLVKLAALLLVQTHLKLALKQGVVALLKLAATVAHAAQHLVAQVGSRVGEVHHHVAARVDQRSASAGKGHAGALALQMQKQLELHGVHI